MLSRRETSVMSRIIATFCGVPGFSAAATSKSFLEFS